MDQKAPQLLPVVEQKNEKSARVKQKLSTTHLQFIHEQLIANFDAETLMRIIQSNDDGELPLDIIFNEPVPDATGKKQTTLLNKIYAKDPDLFLKWVTESAYLLSNLSPHLKGRFATHSLIETVKKLHAKFEKPYQDALRQKSKIEINLTTLPSVRFIILHNELVKGTSLTPFDVEEIKDMLHLLKDCGNSIFQPGTEVLHGVVAMQDASLIKIFLDEFQLSLEGKNQDGYTPFGIAIKGGHFETIKLLLTSYGFLIDLDQEIGGIPALYIALRKPRKDIFSLLLQAGVRKEYVYSGILVNPLLIAVLNLHIGAIRYLLAFGEDPHYKLTMSNESVNNLTEFVIKERFFGGTEESRNTFINKLNAIFQPTDRGQFIITPIALAKFMGDADVIELLENPPKKIPQKRHFSVEHEAKVVEVDTALSTFTQNYTGAVSENKEEKNGDAYQIFAETLFKIIDEHIDDKIFLQGVFFKKSIPISATPEHGKMSLLQFICANNGRMERFFAGMLSQGKYLTKCPIRLMNTYRPDISEEWNTKMDQVSRITKVFFAD